MSLYKVPENVNIEATAQRTDILHFMDVSPKETVAGSEVYQQLGSGFTAMTESPSAQTKERKYINEKSSRKNITSYAPSFSFETLLMFNNPAVKKIYDIYKQRKTGADAVITMITVDTFLAEANGFYPAYKGNYAVEVSSCDDDDDMIIKGNLNGQGDEAIGWFDPKNGVWKIEDPSAEASVQSDDSTEAAAQSNAPEETGTT